MAVSGDGLKGFVESTGFGRFIIAVIVINGLIMGLEATPWGQAPAADWLIWVDRLCLLIFIIELSLKFIVYRWSMFRSGWNVFDFVVVAIALVPASGPTSVLRILRVLRLFRLLSAIPSLRRVVNGFLHAIPGLASVLLLLTIFMYVAAVMATGFFSESHADWFGHIGRSTYTLFQIMTLESWSHGIVRPVMESHPWAWAFFVPFIIFGTFTILNLFIGIIVSTMQELADNEKANEEPSTDVAEMKATLENIQQEMRDLRSLLEGRTGQDRDDHHG